MILHTMIDYDTLRIIWWALIGIILGAYAITDGFDLGTGMLLPFVAKTDTERRIVINTVGPVWEGNQVWLILGGGAIFAAWPALYAVSFSGFYLAMFILLAALIVRPVAFKYRSKEESHRWRSRWDAALCITGLVPALIFGVAMGNVLLGVPFRLEPQTLRIFYDGTLLGLLNPFALLCGLVGVAMMVMQGASWIAVKTEGLVWERARYYGMAAAVLTVLLYALGGVALWLFVDGYQITSAVVTDGPSNPMMKTVATATAAWFANYQAHPWTLAFPALGLGGAALAGLSLLAHKDKLAFFFSSASIAGILINMGVVTFPFMLPSSIDPNASLTVWDASSSHFTLFTMLVATAIFLPLIMVYTLWVYRVMTGKVRHTDFNDKNRHAY